MADNALGRGLDALIKKPSKPKKAEKKEVKDKKPKIETNTNAITGRIIDVFLKDTFAFLAGISLLLSSKKSMLLLVT